MREHRAARKRIVALMVGLATALGMGAPVLAQAQFPAFGMTGLAEGQLAILNLVLVGPPDENHPGCRVTASFVDSIGQVFSDATGNPVSRIFTLRPQIAARLRLRSEDILVTGQLRTSIRPVVSAVLHDTTPSNCNCFVPTLEIVGSNGVTALSAYGHSPRLDPNPGPPPPICEALLLPR